MICSYIVRSIGTGTLINFEVELDDEVVSGPFASKTTNTILRLVEVPFGTVVKKLVEAEEVDSELLSGRTVVGDFGITVCRARRSDIH